LQQNPYGSHSKYHTEEENFTPTGTENYDIYFSMLLRNLTLNKQVLGADSIHFVKNLLTKRLNSKKKDLLNAPGEFKNLLEAITKNYKL